jgi:hypothetical protein
MAITSSAGDGVRITTAAKNGTVKSFTGGKVRLEDPIGTGNNGNLEASPTYTNRLILIDGGTGSGQVRFITAEDLTPPGGDANDVDLDVSEDWVVNPDNTSTFQISYVQGDVATVNGASVSSKTNVLEMTRELSVGTAGGGGAFAFLFFGIYQGVEGTDDTSATQPSIIVEDNGRLQLGYLQGATPVSGAIVTGFRNTADEDFIQINSGGIVRWYASVFRSWLQPLLFQMSASTTSDIDIRDCLIVDLSGSMEWRIGTYGPDLTVQGQTRTTDVLLLEDVALVDGILFTQMHGFDSLDDGLTETITVRNVNFTQNDRHVLVHDDKIWNFVNARGWEPTGGASGFITFEVDDLNEVNKKFRLSLVLSDTAGNKIQFAAIAVYEELTNQNIPPDNKTQSVFFGEAFADILTDKYTFPASVFTTASFGSFALRIYKYGKTPILAPLENDDEGVTLPITMVDDPAITEPDATQAIVTGAASGSIRVERHATGETDPRPINVIRFTGGTDGGDGAPSVGDVITGAGGATGEIIELLGSATGNGFLVLELRNATAYVDAETLTDTTQTNQWTATADLTPSPGVDLDFTWLVKGNSRSMTEIYDYLAAHMGKALNPQVITDDGGTLTVVTGAAKSDVADAFRLLPAVPVANDAIYFGELSTVFQRLGINVSSAGTGGSGTWEYWNGTAWTAVTLLNDGTNGFTTSGSNVVDFTLPTNWERRGINPKVAAQVWQVDISGPTFVDETTDWNSAAAGDVLPFPATEAVGDYFAVGRAAPFEAVIHDTGTAGVGGVVVWEYWNGTAWVAFSDVVDDTNGFTTTGPQQVSWTVPDDWATLSLGGADPLYYSRARITTVYSTNPILDEGWVETTLAYWLRFNVTSAGTVGGQGQLAQFSPVWTQVVEWGEDEQSQLVFSGADGFFTPRNVRRAEGVWISGRGAGAVDFFTDDAGTTFTPPVNRTYTVTNLIAGSEVRIYDDPSLDINLPGAEINGIETSGTSFAHAYQFTASQNVIVHVFDLNHKPVRFQDVLGNADKDVQVFQIPDRDYLNP